MKFHIRFGDQIIASFLHELHRDVALDALKERFSYAVELSKFDGVKSDYRGR